MKQTSGLLGAPPVRRIKEKDLRQQITELLKSNQVIGEEFTGKLVLNFHRGGLNSSSLDIANPL
jgi:hypothetical protein